MKRFYLLLTMLLFLSACTTTDIDPNIPNQEDPIMPTNCSTSTDVVSISSTYTFDANTLWNHSISCDGLTLKDNVIQFENGITEATLTTGLFELPSFIELVPSWNIMIDENVKVRIKLIPEGDRSIDPLLFAYWTEDYKMTMSNQSNSYGRISIDTFLPEQPMQRFAFELQFEDGAFSLKNISVTTKRESGSIVLDESILQDVNVDVPPKQQMSVPTIGSSICSPTSLSMVLEYYNHSQYQADTANIVFDQGASIFGNWSFNASYAGGFEGLYSRVEYFTELSKLQEYLNQGIPIILSIKTTSKEQLTGSLMAYSGGHLVVLRGFEQVDDTWYALVNDPAEYTDENVLRHYPLEQLLSVMRGYGYVLTTTPFEEETTE